MSRKPDAQVGPKTTKRVASSSKSLPEGSTTRSSHSEQPALADEWFVTNVGGNVEPLRRDLVLGSRGQSLRHLKIDKVICYLAARAKPRTSRTLGRVDMAVWKGTKLCAYLHAEAAGGYTAHKIE